MKKTNILNKMNIFAFLLSVSSFSLLPVPLLGIIKVILFCWIGLKEYLDIKNNKKLDIIYPLLALIILCSYDLLINLLNQKELAWTMLTLSSILMILFIDNCRRNGNLTAIQTFTYTCNIFVIISFFECLYLGISNPGYRYNLLICGYSNGLGAFLPEILILNAYLIYRNKKDIYAWLSIILCLTQAIAVWTVTTMICLLLLIVYIIVYNFKKTQKLISPLLIFLSSFLVFFLFVVFRITEKSEIIIKFVYTVLHRYPNLSNRTFVWEKAFEYIQSSLIFGHGSDIIKQIELFGVPNAHNLFLDIICRSGLVGLSIFSIIIVYICFYVKKQKNVDSKMILGAYCVTLIPWQFESYCQYYGYPIYFLVLALSISLPSLLNNYEEKKKQISYNQLSEEENSYYFFKRILDIIFSLVGLVVVLVSSIFIFIANIITNDYGHLFYKQIRIGKNGQPFYIYKFRTMINNADELIEDMIKNQQNKDDWQKYQKFKEDYRITKVGHFLRKLSIDEFPQFLNVLKGEMSLIGPRPLVKDELESHQGNPNIYYSIKPGITSWWACNGRSDIDYSKRLELEYYYIKNCSFLLDLKIVFKTIETMFIKKNGI